MTLPPSTYPTPPVVHHDTVSPVGETFTDRSILDRSMGSITKNKKILEMENFRTVCHTNHNTIRKSARVQHSNFTVRNL